MLWPTPILILLAVALAFMGWREISRPGPGDQRLGGAIFYLAAIVVFILAVLWWIGVVTWKAFFA